MIIKDRYQTMAAIDSNLNQYGNLIDSRSMSDRIQFLIKFAQLINFYDKTNTQNGNWLPFLVKSPAFLGIHIAETDYDAVDKIYQKACESVNASLNFAGDEAKLSMVLNLFFNRIENIFIRLNGWTDPMVKDSQQSYTLKTYTLDNIKRRYSMILWAILNLRTYLSGNGFPEIRKADYTVFDAFNDVIWKTNKNKLPFWEVLGFEKPEDPVLEINKIVEGVFNTTDQLMAFFYEVIALAKSTKEDLVELVSQFPDTLLIRTFLELMQFSQDDMNAITGKHLSFYYDDILKQTKAPPVPDHVFISALLSVTDQISVLPKNTLFDAGTDENDLPVTFYANESVILNPAIIKAADSLYIETLEGDCSDIDNTSQRILYYNTISAPNEVKIDPEGKTEAWPILGNNSGTQIDLGIAFASPMLFLNGGERIIQCSFQFQSDIDIEVLRDYLEEAKFYLSTKEDWFPVLNFEVDFLEEGVSETEETIGLIWTTVLQTTDPAIENFEENPDGYLTKWPLLKIQFSKYLSLKYPPLIRSVTFYTEVNFYNNFVLINNFGDLDPAGPFQPYGPIVNKNAAFYIGSTELFSKPLSTLNFTFNWDNVEGQDLSEYYELYNTFLDGKLIPGKCCSCIDTPCLQKLINTISFWNWNTRTTDVSAEVDCDSIEFSNRCFKVCFELLDDFAWNTIDIQNADDLGATKNKYNQIVSTLFFEEAGKNTLKGNSEFKYYPDPVTEAFPYDVRLQGQDLILDETTAAGFVKMILTEPEEGFGSDIYAQVISAVAFYNAYYVMKKKPDCVIPAPLPPFIPVVNALSAHYTAETCNKFDFFAVDDTINECNDVGYPIQCYHYGIEDVGLKYDNTQLPAQYQETILKDIVGKSELKLGVELYPAMPYCGVFFLTLSNVFTPTQLAIYVELVDTPNVDSEEGSFKLTYHYYYQNTVDELELISDSTNGLTCSGIMTFNILEIDNNQYDEPLPEDLKISIAIYSGQVTSVPNCSFMGLNGIELTRTVNDDVTETVDYRILPQQITEPVDPVPTIDSVIQPFASFGGRAINDDETQNLIISNKLNTKRRAVSLTDYSRLIYQNFDTVFYSKVYFDKTNQKIEIRLVKRIESIDSADAYSPLLSRCLNDKIERFLNKRASYTNLTVNNFKLELFAVSAEIRIKSEYWSNQTKDKILSALKVFLSPWIDSETAQVEIDQTITDVQIANFISDFKEVESIGAVEFSFNSDPDTTNSTITASGKEYLLVPKADQRLSWEIANQIKMAV